MATRFCFRLQPLLDAAHRVEREKREAFGTCRQSAGESAFERERLARARRRCEKLLAEAGRAGRARDARLFDAHLRLLESSAERERIRGAELDARCERARNELVIAQRERRVIETFRERRRRAFECAEARREELEIDEANARRHLRR